MISSVSSLKTKMKTVSLTILLVFIAHFVNAQNNRFIYRYLKKPDSTNAQIYDEYLCHLDITQTESSFYDYNKFKEDSLLAVQNETPIEYGEKVIKKYSSFDTYLLTKIYNTVYAVNDSRKMTWKMTGKKDEFLNLAIYEAVTLFGGRKWFAWFATDIPIQDGPYKFRGLPGLIVKIRDSNNDHIYELIGIQEHPKPVSFVSYVYPKISREKYKKIFLAYRKNPEISLIMNAARVSEGDGPKTKEDISFLKHMEEYLRRKIESDNNHIEKDLLH